MSFRYYWITTCLVVGLTLIIGFITKCKSKKALAIILIKVTFGLATFIGLVAGLAKLLVIFGIAEVGFVL